MTTTKQNKMNITSKNRTFVLTEEQGHYAFNGELILDADDHPNFVEA